MQEGIEKQPRSPVWKLLLLIPFAALAVVLALQFDLRELLRRTLDSISSLGPWGPVLFVLLYIIASICFIPASILTLGAGAVFGVVRGTLFVTVGATLGATAAFLVSRYLAREWIARKIAGNATFSAIDEAVGREGGKIVMLTRLSPIFPFILLNYAFGITKVSLRSYFLGSAVGMLPASLVYVYIGSLAGKVATAGKGHSRTAAEWALLVGGLLATIVVTLFITRLARRALQAKISS